MSLSVQNMTFSYGIREILKDINLADLPRGKLTALLGPNAAGKSTLFKNIAGMLVSDHGRVLLDTHDLAQTAKHQRFKQVCYMPQEFSSHAMLSVFDVVLLARKNFHSFRVSDKDLRIVSETLDRLGIESLAGRYVSELSGGQQQLVSICQALVRDASVYLLDEPTSALDLGRQLRVIELLSDEAETRNAVMMVAIHDLSLALRHCQHIVLMAAGKVKAQGDVESILSSHYLAETYQVDLEILRDQNGKPVISVSSL